MLRIKELRETKGLNMKEAARVLNMPYTTYVNYEKGLREPTSEVLIQLADFYETTVDYLVGRDRMTVNPCRLQPNPSNSRCDSSALIVTRPSGNYTEDENELIRKFRCLDDRGRSAVLNVLNYEYESQTGENTVSAPKEA